MSYYEPEDDPRLRAVLSAMLIALVLTVIIIAVGVGAVWLMWRVFG